MAKTIIRSAYQENVRKPLLTTGTSLAKQASRDECDINIIMDKYQKTGVVSHASKYQGDYGNFITEDDYHSSFNKMLDAQTAFDSLPSSVRKKFHNSPADFLAFVQDEENHPEMADMGLMGDSYKKPEEEAPAPPFVAPAPSENTSDK